MTPTTAEVLEALDVALSCLEMSDVDLEHYQRNPALAGLLRAHRDRLERATELSEAAAALDKLREQLGRDRDALRKVREEMANCESLGYGTVSKWVTALDAILAEEP